MADACDALWGLLSSLSTGSLRSEWRPPIPMHYTPSDRRSATDLFDLLCTRSHTVVLHGCGIFDGSNKESVVKEFVSLSNPMRSLFVAVEGEGQRQICECDIYHVLAYWTHLESVRCRGPGSLLVDGLTDRNDGGMRPVRLCIDECAIYTDECLARLRKMARLAEPLTIGSVFASASMEAKARSTLERMSVAHSSFQVEEPTF